MTLSLERTQPALDGLGFRLGFSCIWEPADPQRTWSHIPWNLRQALAARVEVCDVGPDVGVAARTALKYAYARRIDGRWVSPWKFSRPWDWVAERSVAASVRRQRPDAVLQIGDLARLDVPFFLYQDLSNALLLGMFAGDNRRVPGFEGMTVRALARGDKRQLDIYDRASGIFCFSKWFADSLVSQGLPRERVHVVPPGRNALSDDQPHTAQPRPPRRHRLLIVGRDFHRKGGELLLQALPLVRQVDPRISLTIAGPSALPGLAVPDGVRLVGDVTSGQVAQLMAEHDLFVMPSRFEAFGIAFVEALAAGLPCVARAACAMPEIIQPPRYGRLVEDDDPRELASAILEALADDQLYERCAAASHSVRQRYTWAAAADSMLSVISATLG